ncbi:MAG: hypothetical protein PF588_00405 [Candidatus Kapabacteria bacterium]|jgi:hypothetical protein|nr:hypothetical protein [Candidatus Kapabacteria bacterium]
MIEFIEHIEEYSNYWFSSFSKIVPEERWGNKTHAKEYMIKYWLNEQEYQDVWKPIQDKVFSGRDGLPNQVFNQSLELIAMIGC